MEIILGVIGVSCLGICITQFTPLQRILDDKCSYDWVITLFSCSLCLSFWIGLIYFQNPFNAAISAVLSSFINKLI